MYEFVVASSEETAHLRARGFEPRLRLQKKYFSY
jgi:hypothetical protein